MLFELNVCVSKLTIRLRRRPRPVVLKARCWEAEFFCVLCEQRISFQANEPVSARDVRVGLLKTLDNRRGCFCLV